MSDKGTTEPNAADLRAAKKLQAILEDVAGRPLTPEEVARTHQHVAEVNAIFDAGFRRTV